MLYLWKKSKCILILVPLSEIVRAFCKPLIYLFIFLMKLLTRDSKRLMACRLELSQRRGFLIVQQQVCSWAASGSVHRGPPILRAAFLLLASRALSSPFAWEDSYWKYKSPWFSTVKPGMGTYITFMWSVTPNFRSRVLIEIKSCLYRPSSSSSGSSCWLLTQLIFPFWGLWKTFFSSLTLVLTQLPKS